MDRARLDRGWKIHSRTSGADMRILHGLLLKLGQFTKRRVAETIGGKDYASLDVLWCKFVRALAVQSDASPVSECRFHNSAHIRIEAHTRFNGALHKDSVRGGEIPPAPPGLGHVN
jgi:hypothetical protein